MSPSGSFGKLLASSQTAPKTDLSPAQIAAAFAVAALADFVQLPMNAVALTGVGAVPSEGADLVVDGITAFILWRLLGFHWILLPTVVLESVPFVDAAPTWLACVAFVVWSRRAKQHQPDEQSAPGASYQPAFPGAPYQPRLTMTPPAPSVLNGAPVIDLPVERAGHPATAVRQPERTIDSRRVVNHKKVLIVVVCLLLLLSILGLGFGLHAIRF